MFRDHLRKANLKLCLNCNFYCIKQEAVQTAFASMEHNISVGDASDSVPLPPQPPSPPALEPSQGFDLLPDTAVIGRQIQNVAAQAGAGGASGTSSLPDLPIFHRHDISGEKNHTVWLIHVDSAFVNVSCFYNFIQERVQVCQGCSTFISTF